MRSIGLDIHRDFCEVAIAEGGEIRSPGRIEMTPRPWSCSPKASATTIRWRSR
jgi:hypothetical protein